ncbi:MULTISPECIES: efflux transporter outer membrane subunit [unclassified Cupriavidus]|uniref:efflux transporter outer membrane subunit n=1 Tax=unclassified Cupriavidus TaxID=2640874 RepID=UPI00048DA6E1|nr:efflux transporter outer membrane subunit [Cupriavidus sp. amp6]MBP0632518.1 efflux transporter outer membrane subunit [Cupriavidus sp. AcVe19-1a]MBP0634822.1 efflux transporter outer membrane subunit [Cupriavidus sp. AcVe19-6a]
MPVSRISAPRVKPTPTSRRLAWLASAASVTCAALLAGCADFRPPVYQRPETPAKAEWSRQGSITVSPEEAVQPNWWHNFNDPYLDGLIDQALAGNYDIKVLAARIRVANAQIGEARAGGLPVIDIGAGASFEKSTGQKSTWTYNAGAQLNWDIDIWGKVEKGVQAQTAEFRATEADWRAGYLTLVSNVSTTYFTILQFDEQIEQQTRTVAKNGQILSTYQAMYQNGLVPKIRVMQQQAEINRLNKDLLELRRSRDVAENALATLVGVPAGNLKVPAGRLQDRVKPPSVPAGLPSQLLARRPDIVAAEYRVLAAYNIVGQARLAQLPSISLTARGGTASFALSDLLKSFTFGFMPSINLPMLDPSVRARVKTTEAQVGVAENEYGRAVMTAFEEVESALVNVDAHKKQRVELQQQVEQLRVVSAQIEAQLREGVVSQLEVFETERSLLNAQLQLLAVHQQILADTVTLYKALGGGWPDTEVRNTAASQPQ